MRFFENALYAGNALKVRDQRLRDERDDTLISVWPKAKAP
jgi:hypothetical protein